MSPTKNSDMPAQPISGACCRPGFAHEGEPKGKIEKIEGVESYITTRSSGKTNDNVIIYFPDVHGLSKNALLMMDTMAQQSGGLVIGIEYLNGVSSPNFGLLVIFDIDKRYRIPSRTARIVHSTTLNSTRGSGRTSICHFRRR
jgi:hypothetical protein